MGNARQRGEETLPHHSRLTNAVRKDYYYRIIKERSSHCIGSASGTHRVSKYIAAPPARSPELGQLSRMFQTRTSNGRSMLSYNIHLGLDVWAWDPYDEAALWDLIREGSRFAWTKIGICQVPRQMMRNSPLFKPISELNFGNTT